jgi:SAM-dependent methyltransferase
MTGTTHDRGVELYEGRVGTPVEQRLLAARIHWMVSHIEGREVLDVGCGQGLASLLLAREGRRAVGIDRDAEVVDWARRRVMGEQESIRGRLAYEVAEAGDLPFGDGSFDAVLIGAVLEEQVDPSLTLRESLRVLRPGGRLVITALYAELRAPPFGEPLYLRGLIELLSARVALDDLALLGQYIALAGSIPTEGDAKPAAATWRQALTVAERTLAQLLESSLQTRTELERAQAELDETRAGVSEAVQDARGQLTQERDADRARLDEAQIELTQAHEQLVFVAAQRDALLRDVERVDQQVALAEGRARELQGELVAHSVRIAKLETELEGLRAAKAAAALSEQRRADAEDRAAELRREATALRGAVSQASARLASLEAERTALARESAQAIDEAARLEQLLAGDREALLATRGEAAQSTTEARQALAEVAEQTARIERLNAKIARQAELIADLDRVASAAESDRTRLEERWHHATDRAEQLERELSNAREQLEQHNHADALAESEPAEVSSQSSAAAPDRPPVVRAGARRSRAASPPGPGVMHLIARSLPQAPSAIALDRHGLLVAQRAAGLDSSVMTELDFPGDAGVPDPRSCEFVDGVAYYRLNDPGPPNGSSRLARATTIAGELLEIVDPQVLHAASVDVAPLALALAERHGLRCVIELAWERNAVRELDFALLAAADHLVALSDGQLERAVDAGIPRRKLEVIPPFVDTTRFARSPRPRDGTKSPLLGVVAYGTDSPAIGALRETIAASGRPIRGLIVRIDAGIEAAGGRGWKADIPDGGVAEVHAAATDIARWLGRMDIVIAATPHEALDAMAASRAVIGIDGATVVAPEMSELPSLLRDARVRAARGSAARKTIAAHNTTAAIGAYTRLYALERT